MSPLENYTIRGLLLCTLISIAIAGCSSPNKQTIIDPDTGKHPANWYADHRAAYRRDPARCAECHGADLRGGISGVSCFSASFNGMSCHANGFSGHPAGWANPDSHGATAKAAPAASSGFASCQACHGNDFSGGTVQRTCLNTAGCHGATVNAPHSPAPWRGGTRTHTNTNMGNAVVCALCHTNGANSSVQPSPPAPAGTAPGCFNSTLCHGAVAAPHPVDGTFLNPALHGPVAKADLTYCEVCHADPPSGGAGSNPKFNVPLGRLTAGCEDCHVANTAHPVPWRGSLPSVNATAHQTAGNLAYACTLCHGVNLAGGAGPACSTCHAAGSPLTLANCTSCHGKPPAGTASPNREGAHAEHNALPRITNVCTTCHNNAGTGTLNHDYTGGVVDVAFLGTTYNGNAGSLTYTAASFSCSNVSCHGGPRTQTATQAGQNPPQSTLTQTPSWLSGAINVNTDCTACHVLGSAAGSPEDNSYWSGEHYRHVYQKNKTCTQCHDTAKLAAGHFANLDTAAFEVDPATTILNAVNYNGASCNPGSISGCHGSETW